MICLKLLKKNLPVFTGGLCVYFGVFNVSTQRLCSPEVCELGPSQIFSENVSSFGLPNSQEYGGAFQSPYSAKHLTPQPFFLSVLVCYLFQLCISSQEVGTNAFTVECFPQMPNSSLKEFHIRGEMIASSDAI